MSNLLQEQSRSSPLSTAVRTGYGTYSLLTHCELVSYNFMEP